MYPRLHHIVTFPFVRLVTVQVGNGGFSLRRIAACLALLEEFPETREQFLEDLRAGDKAQLHEDFFFALLGTQSLHFKIPNERVASTFALEGMPDWYFKANGGRSNLSSMQLSICH